MQTTDTLVARAAAYYTRKLGAYGCTFKGVDWSSAESQERRFIELLRIGHEAPVLSLNDFGCGYGALVDHLRRDGRALDYCGYDAASAMVAAARGQYSEVPGCVFTTDRTAVKPREYTVASGVFNVKLDAPAALWWEYVQAELDAIAAMSLRGFAFNLLTAYSDADRHREDLFYAQPETVFAHCVSRFSRAVALMHDYPLYEFTVLVRL